MTKTTLRARYTLEFKQKAVRLAANLPSQQFGVAEPEAPTCGIHSVNLDHLFGQVDADANNHRHDLKATLIQHDPRDIGKLPTFPESAK